MTNFFLSLSPLERIVVGQLLPQRGNYSLQKPAQELGFQLEFTKQEIEDWGMTITEERTRWDPELCQDVGVALGEVMSDYLVQVLRDKNAAGTLALQEVSLYEKLVLSQE